MEKRLSEIDAKKVTIEIRKLSARSKNEEELKINTEFVLRKFVLDRLKIPPASYEHKTLVSGKRKDALYGTVIIEYKAPGKLADVHVFESAKTKVKEYISETAQVEQYYDKYFGVILDGRHIAFVRYREGEWEEQDKPLSVNRYTILRLLQAIRGLARKPLDAEVLLTDFGPQSVISKNCVLSLYETLKKSRSSRTNMLFEDWKTVFSQICAYSKQKLKGLIKHYAIQEKKPDVEKILFAVHTYYTLLMKLLTSEIITLFADSIIGSYLTKVEEAYYRGPQEMQKELKELEEGGLFYKLKIRNFLEADYFAWYIDDWNRGIADAISGLVNRLMDYEPATVELSPERVKDLFKRLYQNLVPRDVRQKLGEYFTPDWLAELLLNEIQYDGHPEKSVLDPACGSGTFLVLAIKRVRHYAKDHFLSERSIVKKITQKIKGIDLNPLAVMASKANYLIALADLLRYKPKEGIEIPVYLADSIFVGRKKAGQPQFEQQKRMVWDEGEQHEWEAYITTNEGLFWMPMEVIDGGYLSDILDLINECVKSKYSEIEFLARLRKAYTLRVFAYKALQRLYKKILKLERMQKNRIWTRLLKNRFAPLFIGKFDYVVGNPPWINWENLPKFHRDETKVLWDYYGLLDKTAGVGLGKTKRDLAMLFVARCFDRYTKDGNVLSFLVPWTLFKTEAGAGFRKFLTLGFTHGRGLGKAVPVRTVKVHDLVELHPFENAVNRAALVIVTKGQTSFPISCEMWSNPSCKKIPMAAELESVKNSTKQNLMSLVPVVKNNPLTPWMILTENARDVIDKVIGQSVYDANEGVNTAHNSIYWLEIIENDSNGLLIKNTQLKSFKKKVREVTCIIEPDFLYPLIRGEDVKKWSGTHEKYILIPHDPSTGKPLDERYMKINYPKTYAYFYTFKKNLANRSLHKLWGKGRPFYSVYDIGSYTFAPYKVLWKRIAGAITGKAVSFAACVVSSVRDKEIGQTKPLIPNDSMILLPAYNRAEAFYICGLLNSTILSCAIASYTYELRMETHIAKYIRIHQYDRQNSMCVRIAELAQKAEKLAANGDVGNVEAAESQIDELVSKLYGITPSEFKILSQCLSLLKSGEVSD